MSLARYQRQWKRQPPDDDAEASRKWLQRGLVALFDCRAGIERIGGDRASVNTPSRAVTEGGVAADFSSTANQRYAHRPAYVQAGPFSLLILCDVDALTNYGALISKQQSSTSRCPYELRLGSAPTNSRIDVIRADVTSPGTTTIGGADLISAPARLVRIVLSVTNSDRNSTGSLWVNGSQTNFSPAPQGVQPSDNGSSDVWIGRRQDGATQLDGRIYHIGLVNRAVTAGEADEFTRNPWSVFEPKRIWVPVGVVVAGTLAATETGDDTAAISGSQSITGTLAAAESGDDAASVSGDVFVAGTIAATETGDDAAALSGAVLVKGALAATESGNDIAAINGSSVITTTGTCAATESGADTASISGDVIVQGMLAAVESGDDSCSLPGQILIVGAVSAIEPGSDTASIQQAKPVHEWVYGLSPITQAVAGLSPFTRAVAFGSPITPTVAASSAIDLRASS